MGSFSIEQWVAALLIVAVILGARKLASSLATRTKPLPEAVPLGVESAWPVFLYRREAKRTPRRSSE
jgi:hypothetical protein